jgi:hypothetical protein
MLACCMCSAHCLEIEEQMHVHKLLDHCMAFMAFPSQQSARSWIVGSLACSASSTCIDAHLSVALLYGCHQMVESTCLMHPSWPLLQSTVSLYATATHRRVAQHLGLLLRAATTTWRMPELYLVESTCLMHTRTHAISRRHKSCRQSQVYLLHDGRARSVGRGGT